MSLARELVEATDEQLREKLAGALPTSAMWFGVTAEIQRRQLITVHSVLERAEKQTGRLEQQVDKLLTIAEAQRLLAVRLEGQTNTLIWFTRALCGFTVVLVILTAGLLIKERLQFLESRRTSVGQPQNPPSALPSVRTNQGH
jgi:hypothetical protein